MTAPVAEVPYEPQQEPRSCGAACLCMVYQALGRGCPQAEVHAAVAGPGRARTHRLALDALGRGLAAVIVQARAPWDLLRRCAGAGLYAVLNHRVEASG